MYSAIKEVKEAYILLLSRSDKYRYSNRLKIVAGLVDMLEYMKSASYRTQYLYAKDDIV